MSPALAMILGGLGGCIAANGIMFLGYWLWDRRRS